MVMSAMRWATGPDAFDESLYVVSVDLPFDGEPKASQVARGFQRGVLEQRDVALDTIEARVDLLEANINVFAKTLQGLAEPKEVGPHALEHDGELITAAASTGGSLAGAFD